MQVEAELLAVPLQELSEVPCLDRSQVSSVARRKAPVPQMDLFRDFFQAMGLLWVSLVCLH
jgi:hypothetical protein